MELNENQNKVVKAMEQNILCIAPPGSGKTRVLVERAAYMIEHRNVSPYEMLLLTFTRKAAGEMRARIEERIGFQAKNITIGTFHAVALRLIQRFGNQIGLRPGRITVYGDWETQYLLKDIAKELGIYKKAWKPRKKDIDAVFNHYYNTGEPPVETDPVYPLFISFAARLRENNSLTYGSILTGLNLLLPDIYEHLKWKHIMMDESQDSDALQWSLVENIRRECKTTLFCVADVQQSIYSFRGAVPEYLIQHQDEFIIYHLEINYRSDSYIVEAANNLISHNEERIAKSMKPFKKFRHPVKVVHNIDSGALVSLIRKILKTANTKNIAVLARNHYLLRKTSELLKEAEISHTYIGEKTKLTNTENFRKFHAFLKLIVNPFDQFSFLLVREIIGISIQEYADIRLQAAKEGRSHFQVYMDSTPNREFFNQFGGYDFAEKVGCAVSEKFNAVEIVEFINESPVVSDREHPIQNISNYLDWLATIDIQDTYDKNSGLILSTSHGVKGLEFDQVIIAGMNDGILPSKQAIAGDKIKEERRLFYVSVTRAREKLIVTVRPEQTTTESGKTFNNPISRFIKELGV